MPTAARVIYDGAICHIIQRGNNRQKIFREDEDYVAFLGLISRYAIRYNFNLYNYCLMSNHLHLLIKIVRGKDLSKLMQGIFQSYRFYYRRKYKHTGYLFQGRYKSKIIESDSYLLECARYIEKNPVRAGIVKDLSCYKWSSYVFYACGHRNDIITENVMFSGLGSNIAERQKVYQEYVLVDRTYEDIVDKELNIIK